MSEIVRTDTLFGSKKNIIGSTSADLVLETLGKVYIKTGKSSKTLTEILSEYSKNSTTQENSTIDANTLSKLLSEDYLFTLINQVLNKNKIFGEFVTVDSVRNKGDYMLPVYFDSNAEAQTILGLSVKNKIETEDYIYGKKGVSTSGICDLTVFGEYGGGGINEEFLELYLANKDYVTGTQLDTFYQTEIENTYLIKDLTDIPDAGQNQRGLVNYGTQTFYGVKTFHDALSSLSVSGTTTLGPILNVGSSTQCNIILNRTQGAKTNYINILTGSNLAITHCDVNGSNYTTTVEDLNISDTGVISIYHDLRLNNNTFIKGKNASGSSYYNLIGVSNENIVQIGNSTYKLLFMTGPIIPFDTSLQFYNKNGVPVRSVALTGNTTVSQLHFGAYWAGQTEAEQTAQKNVTTNIYGKEITFYTKPDDTNIQAAKINEYGLTVNNGIACGGVADMTITVSRSQLADLQNRIAQLEEQVATLSGNN